MPFRYPHSPRMHRREKTPAGRILTFTRGRARGAARVALPFRKEVMQQRGEERERERERMLYSWRPLHYQFRYGAVFVIVETTLRPSSGIPLAPPLLTDVLLPHVSFSFFLFLFLSLSLSFSLTFLAAFVLSPFFSFVPRSLPSLLFLLLFFLLSI